MEVTGCRWGQRMERTVTCALQGPPRDPSPDGPPPGPWTRWGSLGALCGWGGGKARPRPGDLGGLLVGVSVSPGALRQTCFSAEVTAAHTAMGTVTHVCTSLHTCARSHVCMYQTRMYTQNHLCTHVHTATHVQHTCMHRHVHTCTDMHTQPHACTRAHTHTLQMCLRSQNANLVEPEPHAHPRSPRLLPG